MFGRVGSWSARRVGRERGQILVLVAGAVTVLLGFSAVAVDIGSYAADRRTLQNAADAAALAGARDLPNAAAAEAAAVAWAVDNGVPASNVTTTVIPRGAGQPNPLIRVKVQRDHNFFFARVLGIGSRQVAASASAVITSPGGLDGLVPFGVLQSTLAGVQSGASVTLKYDAHDVVQGNFGPVQIDGAGSGNCNGNQNDKYCYDLMFGSTQGLCAQGVPDCPDPSVIPTQPGNKIGPTREGIEYRLSNTSPSCDTFGEVFHREADGTYSLIQQCNPFVDGSLPSLRVIMIPVISDLCNGNCDVTVTSFAMFYLTGFGPGGCQGGQSCEVTGIYVKTNQNVGALMGVYDPNSPMHFVRLLE